MTTLMRILTLTLFLFLAGCDTQGEKASQPATQNQAGFSFVAMGDSRPLMYMPYTNKEEATIRNYFKDMFDLEDKGEYAKKIPLGYDPQTGKLHQIKFPYPSSTPSTLVINFRDGWATEAYIIENKTGKKTTSYRSDGGSWVAHEVAQQVNNGRKFVVHAGDIVWWGDQGRAYKDSPYWQKVDRELLSKLPAPGPEMKQANLYGRYFPAIGNHEVFYDPEIEGVLTSLPWLQKLGVSKENFIYSFDFRDSRFIFLYTGPFDYKSPSDWNGKHPDYKVQEAYLKQKLDEARANNKIKNIFITMHNPVFASSGEFPAIPEEKNPHKLIASYAKDLDITVFNGHIHTTEVRIADGVRYMLLGGAGGEQEYSERKNLPPNYPKERYWNGQPRIEDYNYVVVDVTPEGPEFTLHRYRPETVNPFESVRLYQDPD